MLEDSSISLFAYKYGYDAGSLVTVDNGNYLALINSRNEHYQDATIVAIKNDNNQYRPIGAGYNAR